MLVFMSAYEAKLKNYINKNNILCEQLIFSNSCHSVEEAMAATGAKRNEFVKNICIFDSTNRLIVGIIKGEDKIDLKKVASALSIEGKLVFATPAQILEKTGYPCGGTPSFGYPAIFIIDEKVLEKEVVYSGGGSENSLIKINPKELLKANSGKIAKIRK